VTSPRRIVIGVDTHLDTIHVAAITDTGQVLGDAEFGTDPTGYYVALRWAQSFGDVLTVGVEGTSSYGAGFTQALQDNDIHVVEVTRPDRAARRRQGKSDPLDAYSAARAVLAGHGVAVPKDPHTQALKALLVARRGAVKARSAAIQQIKDLLVTAPADLRERYRRYPTTLKLVCRSLQKDILRLLKRAIAREMFKHLTAPCPIDDYSDLRPTRQAKNITLTSAATHFGVWPNDISRLERGLKRHDTLAANYRRWLNTRPSTPLDPVTEIGASSFAA
jgi:hypothetical protein